MTTCEKRVVELGLTMMRPNVKEERIAGLIKDGVVDGTALAALINECKMVWSDFFEKNEDDQADAIRSKLEKIDGEKAIAASDPDDLVEWITTVITPA